MKYDLFLSYSRLDNVNGWVNAFAEALQLEHREATAGSHLRIFLDTEQILSMQDWELRIMEGLRTSRLLIACISPNYFASKWCRREWDLYLEHERDHGLPGEGIAPIYFVEVPGYGDGAVDHLIASWIRDLSSRQHVDLRPFYPEGPAALMRAEIRNRLAALDQQISDRLQRDRLAMASPSTVPAHNPKFTGRTEELRLLRHALFGGRVGAAAVIHGLGGEGKSAIAFEYAQIMAAEYPGGRWLVPCEGHNDLKMAFYHLAPLLQIELTEHEKTDPELGFQRMCGEIKSRGTILLLLDNIDDPRMLSPAYLSRISSNTVHILATTRLPPADFPGDSNFFLAMEALPETDSLRLFEKHRAFEDESERDAAENLASITGGFVLAVESLAVYLRAEKSVTYAGMVCRLKSEAFAGVEAITGDGRVTLSRHNEPLLSATLGSTIELLSPIERRALEIASLLPPDCVPLPWLRELLGHEFPQLLNEPAPGWPDPWIKITRRLDGMRFFLPDADIRLRRMHRLVSAYVCSLAAEETSGRVEHYVWNQGYSLYRNWTDHDLRWNLLPLKYCAHLWLDQDRAIGADLAPLVARPLRILADFPEALRLLEKAITWCRILPERHAARFAHLGREAGQLASDMGKYSDAVDLLNESLSALESHGSLDSREEGLILMDLASTKYQWCNILRGRAIDLMLRAHEIFTRKAVFSDNARVRTNLAMFFLWSDSYEDAKNLCTHALKSKELMLGIAHVSISSTCKNLGLAEIGLGGFPAARELLERSRRIEENVFGSDHPRMIGCHINFAALEFHEGNPSARIEYLLKALDISSKRLGTGHETTNWIRIHISQIEENPDIEPLTSTAGDSPNWHLDPDDPFDQRI